MHTFETPGSVLLTIDNAVGEVEVETSDTHTTTVEVTALRDDEASRAAAEGTRVDLRSSGDGHEVVVEVPSRPGFLGRDPRVRVAVRAPFGASAGFLTASADVTLRGRIGALRGKTASGDVRADDCAEVRVQTASGDLRFGDVTGAAELRTASGSVTVGHVRGLLDATVVSGDLRVRAADAGGAVTTVSGDVEVEAVTAGDLAVSSVSGDLTIGIRAGSRVHVDVTTLSGDLRSDLDLGDTPPAGDGPLVEVRGRTVSGDLRVRRAAAVGV